MIVCTLMVCFSSLEFPPGGGLFFSFPKLVSTSSQTQKCKLLILFYVILDKGEKELFLSPGKACHRISNPDYCCCHTIELEHELACRHLDTLHTKFCLLLTYLLNTPTVFAFMFGRYGAITLYLAKGQETIMHLKTAYALCLCNY